MELKTREERQKSVEMAKKRNSLGLSQVSHSEFYETLLKRYIDGEITLEEKGKAIKDYYRQRNK